MWYYSDGIILLTKVNHYYDYLAIALAQNMKRNISSWITCAISKGYFKLNVFQCPHQLNIA